MELLKLINQPLPVGIVMVAGIVVLTIRINDLKIRVDKLTENCNERLKWCIDHFRIKDSE